MGREVELRALVPEQSFDRILSRVSRLSDYRVQCRCFIDYSTFLEGVGERRLDVRVRITGSVPEIVVKRGEFGGAVREEAVVKFDLEELDQALALMNLLGYSKGVAGGRRIHRATDGEIELALQEVLDYGTSRPAAFFVEVEDVSGSDDEAAAIARLESYLRDLHLSAFTVGQWNNFVEDLNRRFNGVYEHGVTDPDIIRRLGR